MNSVRPQLGTVAVAAATAIAAVGLTAGGPAIAASVVAYAKNAGAVDGKSAVAANSSVDNRKGKLVATGNGTGRLPNNIIAQAPDSAKLGGIPLSGLAPALLHSTGAPDLHVTTSLTTACVTPVLRTTTASIASVEADLNIAAGSSTTAGAAMVIQLSLDGGLTWTDPEGDWLNLVSASPGGYAAVSHVTTVALPAGARVAFSVALEGVLGAPPAAECSVTASVLHRTPGTVLNTVASSPTHMGNGAAAFGRRN